MLFRILTLKRICLFAAITICMLSVVSCDRQGNDYNAAKTDMFLLKQALDSVDVLYQDPQAYKIITRVREKVNSDPGNALYIRTLRLTTTVLLSKPFASLVQLDSAVSFAHEAKKLALLGHDSIEWAYNEIQIGRYLYLRSFWLHETTELPGASNVLLRAVQFLEKKGVTDGLSQAYHWLSGATAVANDGVAKKLTYELRALHYNDSVKFTALRAKICNDLAVIYKDHMKNIPKGKSMLFRALTIWEKLNDADSESVVLANIGEAFLNEGDVNEALRYYKLSANVADSAKHWKREAIAYNQIAEVFQKNFRYDSAIIYNKRAIDTLKNDSTYSPGMVIRWQANLAESYMAKGDRDFAFNLVEKFEQALPHIEGQGLSEDFAALEHVVSTLPRTGDLKKLADAQQKLLDLRNTIFAREQMIEVGRIESQYEIQLKDKELEVLQLSLSIQAENATKEKWIRILLIVGIVITTIGLILVLRLLRQQNKFNNSLAERSEIIEHQKHELEKNLQELQRTQGYMLTSEKMVMLGQFTAGVAHELNNPLNFISGGVSVLDDVVEKFLISGTASKEDVSKASIGLREVLKNINNGVARMAAIVESLQVFSNSKETLTETSEAEVSECLDASLMLIKSKLDRDAIEVLQSYTPVKVRGHSGRLSQVFINLIDNAIYAVLNNPVGERQLVITMAITPDRVNINFADNGQGIPEEIHRSVFHAFFTTKQTGQGTGLGLFICYNIVKDFGGTITFESKVGKGTTFTVSLLRSKFTSENF